ncbi:MULTISPECIES: (d)CMP kinase [unclassified Oceanispirochaeta]|uniref:(d)CMP kinase n=1 Tax=unclassified Oceanispirochaeta TaxID=2635722 RepID=UPI000E098845|nr:MULTISPECIES: (d)CMP kinase [unclassified Oceanispirochaeta]MBF9016078.1 (d)CMP kinase [Oceanispirochaeta sp. M2]NPD72541.1 (d)CMP kinase [Oceanispirochaeta sp. M1]RDG31998.1 (d)CMP kinase [Oceanispirochaeta sp. M1]
MIVAIDGPAGVGKSTIASTIAREMGYFNLNSGNFYRAVSLSLMRNNIKIDDEKTVSAIAKGLKFDISDNHLYMNDEDVEDLLHNDEVDAIVAEVSAIVPVRHIVNEHLRILSKSLDLVAEGRDMTTVVFPHGEVKVFLDASPEIRAERRFKQGVSTLSYEEILEGIRKRDVIDRNKKEGSLIISDDALYIDTSSLTLEQVCEKVTDKIKELK